MTRSLSWRLGRGATTMLVLAASLVLSGGQTLAATQVGHSGTTGHYSFTDTSGSPGAKCIYQGTMGALQFDHMWVKAPRIYWPTSDSFPNGTVGWRLQLQHWDGHAWHTVRTTSEARALATKASAASLSARSVNWASPHDRTYRVRVRIRWMTPDATTIGSSLVRIDHYRRGYDDSVGYTCKAEVPTS